MAKSDIAQYHTGAGWYELPNGEKVRGKAKAQKALDALSTDSGKEATPRKNPNPELATTTKKSLDDMTEAHRRHIERWEPHLEVLEADHVWAATPRRPGRSNTLFYLAVKFGSKDYGIVGFDTETQEVEDVNVDRVTSPKTILEQFREFRSMAKEQRDKARSEAKSKDESDEQPEAKTTKKVVKKKKAS